MSSFIGHSLTGLTAYATTQQLQVDRSNESSYHNWLWLAWLLVIASMPDIDYLMPGLRVQHANQILRITHSSIGALLVPSSTILVLWLLGKRGQTFKIQSLQLVLAGLSHLLLDLLTGVFPLPLLYPFSTKTFRLPFGLLPSAGRIQLTNYFLYRNLLIELGVLVPLSVSLVLSVRDSTRSGKRLLSITAGLLVSVCFMIWAFTLSR
jgi:membrane-bound metal-dependent hydrolase YbcI (DUF457 family)